MDVSGKHGEKRRFLKDRYGFDAICAFLLWISVLIDLLVLLLPYEEIRPFCWISFIPLLFCVLRIFSRDYDRREMENDLFTAERENIKRKCFVFSAARPAGSSSGFPGERGRWKSPARAAAASLSARPE